MPSMQAQFFIYALMLIAENNSSCLIRLQPSMLVGLRVYKG